MKLSQFKFNFNEKLLATHPTPNRDESRLMVVHRTTGKIEHKVFKDVIDYFDDGDVLVLNNTKVFPARLYGNKEKTGAKIEVFLLRELNAESKLWDVLVDPARKIRIGNKLYFGDDDMLVAEVIDNTTSRGRTLRFLFDGTSEEFRAVIEQLGQTPLPKYIKRKAETADKERYQTVYASKPGAVAAPTAGLHFTDSLLKTLEAQGVSQQHVTLHVGLGTFRPVEAEDIRHHLMHSERCHLSAETAAVLNQRDPTKRQICVGTTCCRVVETAANEAGVVIPGDYDTNIFIYPGYRFKYVDALLTNFHLPGSTLLMLVSAFGGYDLIREAYAKAIEKKFHFFSYGDAMLIL